MLNPNDVNLIIFDTDGTIVPSLEPFYEGIKRAFSKLGWPVTFTAEDIRPFFGQATLAAGGGLYCFIRPADCGLSWQEIREIVWEEYESCFRELAKPFPGVKETLAALKNRGYHLALFTNGSARYLEIVVSSFGLSGYFEHIECVQESNLTKPALAQKIKDKYLAQAAIVVDRHHDIEAARETGSLAIGILFGYGNKEPEQADVTIDSFGELLDIFDRRRPVFETIFEEIKRRQSTDKPFVIGVNGIDCSGKTMFAGGLEDFLKSNGYRTQLISLDDFHNPREIRYAGYSRDEDYYDRVKQGSSFNFKLLIDELLCPISRKKTVFKQLTLLDWKTDKMENVKKYSINKNTVVILEGVFLFIKELEPYIDYKIFLEIPFEECARRAKARDTEDVYKKYRNKYLPAQRKYLKEYPPRQVADIVIDNTDWEYPTIIG
ncbi:MAG: hypothetical protein A2Z15_02265 [Chloroflexi bacterium RBG_16_50_11]|nr:MAG: hypothetical protein A2Z15_02265 [Chloroflexi bacterium RBG_16_50_11]